MLKVVVDANVLVSAVFTPDGPVAYAIFDSHGRIDLICPEIIKEELLAHTGRIAKEIGTDKVRVASALAKILDRMRVVPVNMISRAAKEQADALALKIDPKDVAYVALALNQQAELWTLDRKLAAGLTRHDVHICITTSIMQDLIEQS